MLSSGLQPHPSPPAISAPPLTPRNISPTPHLQQYQPHPSLPAISAPPLTSSNISPTQLYSFLFISQVLPSHFQIFWQKCHQGKAVSFLLPPTNILGDSVQHTRTARGLTSSDQALCVYCSCIGLEPSSCSGNRQTLASNHSQETSHSKKLPQSSEHLPLSAQREREPAQVINDSLDYQSTLLTQVTDSLDYQSTLLTQVINDSLDYQSTGY